MKFELEAEIELSKDVPKAAEAELKKFFDEANKTTFKKGAKDKKEAAELESWKVSKNKLLLKINSGEEVRAHDAVFRMKNSLAELLGKQYKLGIRAIKATKLVVNFETEQEPKAKVTVPFAEVVIKGKKAQAFFKDLDTEFLQTNRVEKVIKLINEKVKNQYYEGKEEYKEYIWQSKEKKISYTGDPAVEMEKRNWIVHTPGKGQFVYGREYTILFNILRELLIKNIYSKLDFNEMIFPKFEPFDIPETSGHISKPQILYFVSVPDSTDWTDVEDYYKIFGKANAEMIYHKTKLVGISSYAQCPPFWSYLRNKTVDESSLPLKIYDWSGPTYRNESGGTHGLDRLEEFRRVETLFVGTKPQVIEIWNKLKDKLVDFFDKVLDIEVKVARVAPWWMAHAGLVAEKGTIETGTYDFDAYLPYRGDRKQEWLEIQNCSSIGAKYPHAFNVKGRKEDIWSGCAGGGTERIICAFLAQKGFDTKNWPKEIRAQFEAEMKKIKPLKFV